LESLEAQECFLKQGAHLEPVDTSSEDCTSCLAAFSDRYKTIYTRPCPYKEVSLYPVNFPAQF
jgi:hypothetical protein